MADNTIDSLVLEISANANGAEKSIEKLIGNLTKLSNSLGGFNSNGFSNIASGMNKLTESITRFSGSVKTADFTRIATGLNKLAGVNVQGVSDASRAISTLTANVSGLGTISFDSQGIANIANAVSQLGRETVTQAAQNIPALTTALGGKNALAAPANIEKLGTAMQKLFSAMSGVPKISQNTIQMTQALANLAQYGGRISSMTTQMSKGFTSLGSSMKTAKGHTFSLAAAFGKFYATYWLIIRSMGLFKEAIDISSDLTEVQNVVDVAFGDMAYKVEDLASHSIEDFGMSESTVKQITSRFQAMGTAMGFTQERMSDMSITLTELAADMASFYNAEQEDVAKSLQSIFTGETEPLMLAA